MFVKIVANKSLPVSRRVVRLVRYCHKKLLGWIAFKSRYRIARRSGYRTDIKLGARQLREYRNYWSVFGRPVETDTLTKCFNISGRYDKHIVPEDIFVCDFEPSLTPVKDCTFLQNKSTYHIWFPDLRFPLPHFHRINGCWYDSSFEPISHIAEYILGPDVPCRGVLKISYASSGGAGVRFVRKKEDLLEFLDLDENLVFQEEITQHESLNELYPGGINSVRMCILRLPRSHELVILNASLRMGKGGSLDNETAGGIVCSIGDDGALNEFAVDKHGLKYFCHPDTNRSFDKFRIPLFGEAQSLGTRIMERIPFAHLASLDLCLDAAGDWRPLEVNLEFHTIRFAQYVGKPFFGACTDEVRSWVLENHWALRR